MAKFTNSSKSKLWGGLGGDILGHGKARKFFDFETFGLGGGRQIHIKARKFFEFIAFGGGGRGRLSHVKARKPFELGTQVRSLRGTNYIVTIT